MYPNSIAGLHALFTHHLYDSVRRIRAGIVVANMDYKIKFSWRKKAGNRGLDGDTSGQIHKLIHLSLETIID